MGFCSRCGELISGQATRCRCGGLPRNASVQVSPVTSKDGNADRWSRTYTSKDKSPSPSPVASRIVPQRTGGTLPPLGMLSMDFNKDEDISPPPRTPPPSDALGTSHTNLAALPPVQRSPGRRTFPKPLNHSSRMSTRSSANSRPSSPLKQAYIPPENKTPPASAPSQSEPATDDDYPTIADESDLGDLTNTLGSTIQPKDTLPVQLCADCDTPFATDAVRYPGLDDPRGVTGVFYCRPCFKNNGGLKGHCAACGFEVLMGRHDGSSVTVRDKLFHSKCFKCSHCGLKVERGHSCDPAGKPCCEPCLDKVLNASSAPTTPATTRARRKSGGGERRASTQVTPRATPAKPSSPAPETPGGGHRPRESLSFLEELKQRQSAGGGAASPSAIRRETLRSRSKSRDADRSRDPDRSRDMDRSRDDDHGRDADRSHNVDDEDLDHEGSPISPINPDMIRRDTMGPRKVGSALRQRAREREREQSASPSPAARRSSRDPRDKPSREKPSGDKPTPRPSRDTGRGTSDKPSPRSAMRSASRTRERSSSPPPQRSAKFADAPPLRRSTSKTALKHRDSSVGPRSHRGRKEEEDKPAPRSALRSSSRPRPSDPKAKRERERERSATPPPDDDSLANTVFPVGKLTRDLGSLSIAGASVDDSNLSTSDSRSTISRSDWTTSTSNTSVRSSMSPPSAGRDKPVLKTRRSGGLRESIVDSSTASDSPSTSARTRRLSRGQIGDKVSGSQKSNISEPPESVKLSAGEEDEEPAEDKNKSMDKDEDFKPTTPSRVARRRSIGRDSPASTTGTVTPSGTRTRPSASSSAKKMTMGDYHDAEEPRTSWLKNRESKTRSFAGSPRGDFSDTSTDSLPWSRRREKLEDAPSPRPVSMLSEKAMDLDAFSPPPAPIPVAPPATSSPTPSKRRVKVDDIVMPIESTERCFGCNEKLHLDGSNMFVTVPGYAKTGNTGEFTPSRTFHVDCFTCSVCELPFGGDAWEGQQARFVQLKDMIAHPECAPPIVRTATYTPVPSKVNRAVKTAPQVPEPPMRSAPARDYAINRLPSTVTSAPAPAPAPVTNRPRAGTMGATSAAPRFGGSMYCPWCSKSVSPMEMGTCPGPNGSRWHSSCLVCGGKDAKKNRKNPKDPGCGKQLDSGAKVDQDGGVWCRECIDKLPAEMRPSSPIKPLVPTHTGGGVLQPQITGGGGFIRPQTTGGGGIIRPQTTGGGGIIRPQTTGGGGGILKPQTTGGGGILKSQTTGGGGFVRPQITGRSTGEINPQYTGTGRTIATQYTGGSVMGPLAPQLTGGVPITMQLTGSMLRSRSPTKSIGNLGELEEEVTGSGRPTSMIASGKGDFATVMALARKGVAMDEPVRERPKSVYGTRSWKM